MVITTVLGSMLLNNFVLFEMIVIDKHYIFSRNRKILGILYHSKLD